MGAPAVGREASLNAAFTSLNFTEMEVLLGFAIGGIFGAVTGSVLATRVNQRALRIGLLLVLIVLGFRLALNP